MDNGEVINSSNNYLMLLYNDTYTIINGRVSNEYIIDAVVKIILSTHEVLKQSNDDYTLNRYLDDLFDGAYYIKEHKEVLADTSGNITSIDENLTMIEYLKYLSKKLGLDEDSEEEK